MISLDILVHAVRNILCKGFAHCHQDQELSDSRVYLSLKLCFGLGFFVIRSVSEFLFWVTLQSPLQVNPAATACPAHNDSTWKTTYERCWMTGMTWLQQEAWEKNQRYFCTLLRIFYFVGNFPFQGNCLLWTIQPISKHTVSSLSYNIQ